MAELKPCPFCGGAEAKLKTHNSRKGLLGIKEFYYVRCQICRASASVMFTRDEAIEAWNRRSGTNGQI